MSASVVGLQDSRAKDPAMTGGKASGLARLIAGGFRVPDGFCVTTDAYHEHVCANGIDAIIVEALTGVNAADQGGLDAVTERIRSAIISAPVPASVAAEITAAYRVLGEASYVAVRSSGTAEDLAEASFAGLHDTYLDITGTAAVVDAVRRCWASMWTTRATAYRHSHGLDSRIIGIAVIVQNMVVSDCSGVMFTANPLNTATDEIVINASWGLGEAVVSGAVTPDQFVVNAHTLQVMDATLGAKEIRVIRDPNSGIGTASVDVELVDRGRFCLTADQIHELARLGIALQADRGGFPLDVEWALQGGALYVLQGRPITGVEFSWDADVDAWQTLPEDYEAVWTRGMSDEGWTGAKTPLMYAWRAESWTRSVSKAAKTWGVPELARLRCWKFHKGEAYYNCEVERVTVEKTFPPFLRPPVLARIPADQQQQVATAPFSYAAYVKVYARMQLLGEGVQPLSWHRLIEDYIDNGAPRIPDMTDAELAALSDYGLTEHISAVTEYERVYCDDVFVPFFLYARDALSALAVLVAKWYDGDNPAILADVLTGTSRQTITQRENHALWTLAEKIRASAVLRQQFETRSTAEFFDGLAETAEGLEFRAAYDDFLSWSGHRGHSDRDLIFPRRIEDHSLDHRSFQSLLSIEEPVDPERREVEVRAARERAIDELVANVRRKPLGAIKAEILKFVADYSDRFLMIRDNERHFVDRSTFAAKRALLEVGSRLVSRGLLDTRRDHYFLTLAELYELLSGSGDAVLARAKVTARRRDFERIDRKEFAAPPYVHRNGGIDLDNTAEGGLHGLGTSRGTVTGTARIIKTLDEIGRLRPGDILVCNATDPGWTPVFVVVSGIVLETGGMLAHASCLAREYALPAVQLPGAMRMIPEGATITVNGDTGEVLVIDDQTSVVVRTEVPA
jgi:phosphohistidine swiveling domain-containing protein